MIFKFRGCQRIVPGTGMRIAVTIPVYSEFLIFGFGFFVCSPDDSLHSDFFYPSFLPVAFPLRFFAGVSF